MHILALPHAATLAQADALPAGPAAVVPGFDVGALLNMTGRTGALIALLVIATIVLWRYVFREVFTQVAAAWTATAQARAANSANLASAATNNAAAAATHKEALAAANILAATQQKSLQMLDGMLDRVLKAGQVPPTPPFGSSS